MGEMNRLLLIELRASVNSESAFSKIGYRRGKRRTRADLNKSCYVTEVNSKMNQLNSFGFNIEFQ